MRINISSHASQCSFGAKLKFNSPELRHMFARELENSGNSNKSRIGETQLKKNIEKFKNMYPNQVIEVTLRPNDYNNATLDVLNPQTMHLKSFPAQDRGGVLPNAFNKMFEVLTGTEAKDFWTDKTVKDLFVNSIK